MTTLTEDLLLSRFREKPLASLLSAVLDAKTLTGLPVKLKLSPLPGKRLKSMSRDEHALLLARTSLEQDRPRKAVLEALNQQLARQPAPSGDDLTLDPGEVEGCLADSVELDMLQRVHAALTWLPHADLQERVLAALENGWLKNAPKRPATAEESGGDEAEQLRATAHRAELRAQKAERAEAVARAEHKAIESREKSYKQRIEALQAELNELQQRLGDKNRENVQLRSMQEELKNDLQVAFRRAARFKHQLDEVKSESERERELKDAYQRERQRADIEQSKVEILEYLLDLAEQEDVAADAAAPDAATDDPVRAAVARYLEKHGRAPKLLIVGGAGKQRSHRERDFAALKERLGFEGEWRFAEYGSWHRELPRLRNDIRDRYDLVFVLHWNRTTFVQKMHDEARALNGRVRTVPYRGFLSLENAVVEELKRFASDHA